MRYSREVSEKRGPDVFSTTHMPWGMLLFSDLPTGLNPIERKRERDPNATGSKPSADTKPVVLCPTPEPAIKGIQPRDINNFWMATDSLDRDQGLFDSKRYLGNFNSCRLPRCPKKQWDESSKLLNSTVRKTY